MEYKQIKYEISDSILTITLNRPENLNAVTPLMITEIIDALNRADADDRVRVVIVTGAGRAFCAGADIETMLPWMQQNRGRAWAAPPTIMLKYR